MNEITNALYTEIDLLKKRVEELEADLKINASMLARQHDRNMELEAARDDWRRITTEAKARVEGLLRDATKMVKDEDVISDGFGSAWSAYCPMCGKRTMQVVRPGKVQCSECG